MGLGEGEVDRRIVVFNLVLVSTLWLVTVYVWGKKVNDLIHFIFDLLKKRNDQPKIFDQRVDLLSDFKMSQFFKSCTIMISQYKILYQPVLCSNPSFKIKRGSTVLKKKDLPCYNG